MSYNKRVTSKIRSVYGPLIMGRRERAEIGSTGGDLEKVLGNWIFGGWSEKGSTRKHTGNRVTRWIFMFWRKLAILR
jgi:hypothetical protein